MPRLLILALALFSFCVFPISPFSVSPDASFQSWCERNDIYSSRVSCRTTEDSVGGRGLFADHDVKEGEVLATIPKRLLLTSSDKMLWAGEIAGKAKDAEPAIDEWVATWTGGFSEDLDVISTLRAPARGQLSDKLELRKAQFQNAKQKYNLDDEDWALYNMVWSRACYLGPQWKYAVGIIPFFDMLNHSPRENVRLSSLGDAMKGFEETTSKPADLDDRDMLIIAKEHISKDSELLTSYLHEDVAKSRDVNGDGDRGDDEFAADELAARRMICWGF
ncbi:hypothetical protein TL16_g10175 [Triparma laevis f. inornata]|uniref:SET domain-containing protein n=2 Tax=Triparma laevis TaxID=1534972 RepID=A0A9W7CD73_9STRA|nr:hypothetical protein TL16_g10175 [Triparma laevis f. inornata]GMI06528.1 hypothetical protein TrLO_g4069 [Triparma laevis f. longispina]